MIGPWSRLYAPVALTALLLLAACGTQHKKNEEKPAKLTDFNGTVKVEKVWSASSGGGALKLRVGLGIATDGKAIYAAGHDGGVSAFNATNGRKLWESKTKLRLTGGPGVGDGLVVAGTGHGDIIALDAATGAQKWKARINSEILSAPAIGKGVVLLRVADGRVAAFSTADGKELWSAQQQVPKLSLRGTAKPTIVDDMALCGFDTGRVMALSLVDGVTVWDVLVAPPSGKSEIERMIDMDSGVKIVDKDVYAVTYHGKAARIDRETGQVLWARDVSSYSGLATDDDGLYVSGSEGALVKLGRRTGVEIWKQEVLAFRRLSPPVVLGSLVVVADMDGYVHFFDVAKGQLAGRIHALGERVTAAPLIVGDLLVMMDDDGRIVALRTTPIPAKNKS